MGAELAFIKAFTKKSANRNVGMAAGAVGAAGALSASSRSKANRKGLLSPLTIIDEGYEAVRTRLGRGVKKGWLAKLLGREGQLYGAAGDGIVFCPTHSLREISVQDRSNDLSDIILDHPKDGQLHIESAIIWAVRSRDEDPPDRRGESLYRAWAKAESGELGQTVVDLCTRGLRQVARHAGRNVYYDNNRVNSLMQETCAERLGEYGVKLVETVIKSDHQVPAQILADGLIEAAKVKHPSIPEDNTAVIVAADTAEIVMYGSGGNDEIARPLHAVESPESIWEAQT